MQIRIGMRSSWLVTAAALAMGMLALVSQGCGGGGSPVITGTPTPTPSPSPTPIPSANVRVRIEWGERSRVIGLSSALSARITLPGADIPSGDIVWDVARPAGTASVVSDYPAPRKAKVGTYLLSVKFYAGGLGADNKVFGDEVGFATASATVTPDGTVTVTIATYTGIQSLEILPNQTVAVNEIKDLGFIAKNLAGNNVAISQGSIFYEVVTNTQNLATARGGSSVQGLRPITATVRMRADNVTSAAQTVTITSDTKVAVSPKTTDPLAWQNTVQITPTVSDLPAGLSGADLGVTWAIEGDPGDGTLGTISSTGLYTAPKLTNGNPLTVKVIATSVFDPTKSDSATITVRSLTNVNVTNPTPLADPFLITVGKTQQFNFSVVNGTMNSGNGLDQTVALVLTGPNGEANTGNKYGTISSAGLYTAPKVAPSTGLLCKITATSQYAAADPTRARVIPIKVVGGSIDVRVD